ncbi:GntR family transcriptional regulator [Extensimonas vulgaris]|jgi:GntR family transcriptional regulator|uniref:GntR family transcriptional regulator n=1 Tax=Extensimonas vulgaris TaxID=1031594 RepID=A0A369AL15_9BURK|nr:GntR family transcriptional regulator [Extensimonas vulgaris]RCX08976.1 GntR family transcriptional regulator [Extensimonas vulgaris]TWI37212.1 GntR family transcriptional regulator [Extensimonas vulgaris]TXD14300.1 GntR family transcriptional regulator [Extensimonas vulgaris]
MSSPPHHPDNPQPPGAAPSATVLSPPSALPTPAFSPLYQQIKGLILQSLQSGEWKPGEAIPSEIELAARFRVSQGTVRKAIDELAAENLVIRRQGKGTFVATHAEQQVQYRFLKLRPDTGDARTEGPAQRSILECRRTRASAEVARALALRSGDPVIQARRILSFAGEPTILEDIWLPGQAFKGLTAEQMADYQGPMYAMLEKEFGVRMVRAEEKIRAVLPDEEQARLLEIAPTTPVLSVERIAYTYNDIPMELRRGLYRTDTHHYHNEVH